MKKIGIFLAGLFIVTNSIFAEGLTSFGTKLENENNLHAESNKTTLTTEANFKLKKNYSLYVDVERSYTNQLGTDGEALYTEISLNDWKAVNKDWNLYLNYSLQNDSGWSEDKDPSSFWYSNRIYLSAYFGRNYKISDKSVYVGIKLDQQLGGNITESFEESMKQDFATGINFFTGTQLTKNLKVDLASYNIIHYEESFDKYYLQLKGEATITHNLPLKNGFSISTEAHIESSAYLKDYITDGEWTDAYITPKLVYDKKFSNNLSVKGSVGYDVVSYYVWDVNNWKSPNNGHENNKIKSSLGLTYIP